jgi:hypothetical protein
MSALRLVVLVGLGLGAFFVNFDGAIEPRLRACAPRPLTPEERGLGAPQVEPSQRRSNHGRGESRSVDAKIMYAI